MQHDVDAGRQHVQVEPHCFTHTPADAIPFHGAAENAARGETDSRLYACGIFSRSFAEEVAHGRGRIAAAFAVHALIVGMLPQTGTAPVESSLRHISILSQSWGGSHREAAAVKARLVAVARADRDTLTALGAPARKDRGTALGLHAGAKAVRLGTAAAVRLKCALRHGKTDSWFSSDSAGLRIASLR